MKAYFVMMGAVAVADTAVAQSSSFSRPRRVPECRAERWKGAAELDFMRQQFSQLSQDQLVQIAWGESLADPLQSVAVPALYYLYTRESHGPLKKYFESLAQQIGAGVFSMRKLVLRYPLRQGNLKVSESLKELCDGYAAALRQADELPIADYERGPKK